MRIGVFGGSFDPVHYGHLRLAEEARERFGLERVLFIPNHVSPFKAGRDVSPGSLRVEMLRRAVADNPAFVVDEREVQRPGPSYTVDTLRELRQENPAAELYFLTGTDAVRDLPAWREPEAVLSLARFIAAVRPGVRAQDVLVALPDEWESRILFLPMPELDISATDLRTRAREGRSLRYLTPREVELFVQEQRLYREGGAASAAALPSAGDTKLSA